MRRDEALISELISRGADPNIQNKYGKTALNYYCYQIRLDDFKSTIDNGTYQRLKKEGTFALGPASMKEFNLVFWSDPYKIMGASMRDKKPLKMEIFTGNPANKTEAKELNPIDQLATIITKCFIASPVFAAEVKTSVDQVIDDIQGYKKTDVVKQNLI